MAAIDDSPASFVVDLAAGRHAPVVSHPLLLEINVKMLRPRPDGLRDRSELDQLGALEDQFVDALTTKVDAIYVGRTVHAGETTLYLYVPASHRRALDTLPALTGAPAGDYAPSWSVDEDPEWRQYLDFLLPDERTRQSIENRRLIARFTDLGDHLDIVREVDHLAYFAGFTEADRASSALVAAGFRVDVHTVAGGARETGDGWAVAFRRDEVLSDGRPDEFVAEILDIIVPLGGTYDGWGAEHCDGT